MKNKLFLITILLLSFMACEEDYTLGEEAIDIKQENLTFKISNTLDIQSLIEASTLDYETRVENKEHEFIFKSYITQESFFDNFKENNNEIETLVIFDDCGDNTLAIGSYVYAEDTKNLYFHLYKNLDDFHNGEAFQTYVVNDYIYNDIQYVRASKYGNCSVSVFFSEELEEREYQLNYNDLSLESAYERGPVPVFVPDPGSGTRQCAYPPACRIYNYDPNELYQCPGFRGCFTLKDWICPFVKGKEYLVVNRYPNYIYYITDVILDDNYYKFRNDILNKSEFGKKYVNLFYRVSGQFIESIDFDLMAKVLEVLPKINASIDNLFDGQYEGAIIDTELAASINDIIVTSSSKSSSSLYKEVLDTFIIDFNLFVNKDRNEVLDLLT